MRYYVLGTVLVTAAFLIGAVHEARNAAFDTITVHRITIVDREGKLALVVTDHDDPQPSIFAGKVYKRNGGGGNEVLFYNELGSEQGGLTWSGQKRAAGSYGSSNVLSFDTVTTDQLLQVDDGNDNGKLYAYMIGWNRPDETTPQAQRILDEILQAKTADRARAIEAQNPAFFASFVRRYLFGYDDTNTAQVMLADGAGRPRIKMYVTPEGEAELQFLDAHGGVVAEYPQAK